MQQDNTDQRFPAPDSPGASPITPPPARPDPGPRGGAPLGSIVLLALLLAGAFFAGMLVDRRLAAEPALAGRLGVLPGNGVRGETTPNSLKTLEQAWHIVRQNYFDRELVGDEKKLTQIAIKGFVDALGDEGHTRYLTPQEFTRQEEALSGEFEGIGAEVTTREGRVQILAPIDGSPAARAGVKPGDVILRVNGEDVRDKSVDYIVSKIRGKAGTDVTITFERPRENSGEFDITITRDKIPLNPVTSFLLPESKIALIRLNQFSRPATDELKSALQKAREAGAVGAVIDVRNNPGGLLNQAIQVSSQFLPEGTPIVRQRGPRVDETYRAEGGGVALDLPIVVLTNNGSASAAEIFAGAIKAAGRGPVVGEKTFGTGTVLNIFKLDDGSAILLGTAEWLTPDGQSLRRQPGVEGGVEPTETVTLAPSTPPLLPREASTLPEHEVFETKDAQLRRALEILRERIGAASGVPAG